MPRLMPALLAVLLLPALAVAGTLDASWTAPTTNTDGSALTNLAGYRVYHSTNAAQLTPCQNATLMQAVTAANPAPAAGTTVMIPLKGLVTGSTYYASVTSLNTAGVESACSPVTNAVARADVTVGTPTDPGAPQIGAPVLGPTTALFPVTFTASTIPSGGAVSYGYNAGYNEQAVAGLSAAPSFSLAMPYDVSGAAAGAWLCVKAIGPPPGNIPSANAACSGFTVPAKPVTSAPPPPDVASTTTCTVTLTATAPDATAGWTARFKMDAGVTVGSVAITPGNHTYYVEWLKNGVLTLTSQKATKACP